MQKQSVFDHYVIGQYLIYYRRKRAKFVGYLKSCKKTAKYSCFDRQVRHQYLKNANFCNFFDNIPQILRVKASAGIKLTMPNYNIRSLVSSNSLTLLEYL